jgi:hypothetical protein
MSNVPEEPVARVTLTRIYEKLLDVEAKVDPLPRRVDDHEIRIRAIEKYLWVWIGAAGVGGAGLGQLINTLINR